MNIYNIKNVADKYDGKTFKYKVIFHFLPVKNGKPDHFILLFLEQLSYTLIIFNDLRK